VDSPTEELRHAHDVLAEWYAERLAGAPGLGVESDSYWLSTREMAGLAVGAGFAVVFQGGRPPEGPESCPQPRIVRVR
jgi:hypothetical protein